MKVHEIMTAHARSVAPENTLVEAAGLMRELDVGALPVCENEAVTGIVTDRDLAIRGVANGRDPNTTMVRDVMTSDIVHVFADQDVEEVARLMEERQIRRVPVLNRAKDLVGIVSLGDIAISSNPAFSGMALRDVSEPTNPTARQRRLAARSEPTRMPMMEEPARRPRGTRRTNRSGTRTKSKRAARSSSRSGAKSRGGSRRGGARKTRARR
jgi:CBS domain-containing protein